MGQAALTADRVLRLSPVIPVVTIEDAGQAVPMARALLAGGIKTVEITLRTPAAPEAIRLIARDVPEMAVGAGTVLREKDLWMAAEAGAAYALSPGAGRDLLRAAKTGPIPLIPGVATASEVMTGFDLGYRCFKFFPAQNMGGVGTLKDLYGPLPQALFCPTGGIGPDLVDSYLALPNVACVGGSWVTPQAAMHAGDWLAVEALAKKAAAYGE